MNKVKWLAKRLGVVLAVLIFSHFFAAGVHISERYLGEKTAEATEWAVGNIAEAGGYARPVPQLSDFTALQLVEREALACNINPALARALLIEESARNQSAKSSAGAIGLMQVMPFNAKLCGLTPEDLRENTVKNIRCGLAIFCDYMRGQSFDPWRALQEYNGGAKCINKCDESIKHAQKVLKRMAKDLS